LYTGITLRSLGVEGAEIVISDHAVDTVKHMFMFTACTWDVTGLHAFNDVKYTCM
jgi:hypothetical protein